MCTRWTCLAVSDDGVSGLPLTVAMVRLSCVSR